MTKCMVMGCEREATRRGMCNSHHRRWLRETPHGEREPVPRPTPRHVELVGLFGGVRPFCRAVGIDSMTFYRWGDEIPKDRWVEICDGGERVGLDRGAVLTAIVRGL